MCQEYRRRQLDFSHEHRGLRDHHFAVGFGHDPEGVFATHQLYIDVYFVQHVTILEENVGMQTPHHVYDVTPIGVLRPYLFE